MPAFLISKIQKLGGLTKFQIPQLRSALQNIEKHIKQLSSVSDGLKIEAEQESQAAEQELQNIMEESGKPPMLQADASDISDLIGDIASQTQYIAKTCFQSFLANIPSRFIIN